MTKEFNSDDLKNMTWKEENERLELIEEGDWISEGKYEHCEYIFKDKSTGKHYVITNSRSGSYHTDWYYADEDWGDTVKCQEVNEIEVVTTKWKAV